MSVSKSNLPPFFPPGIANHKNTSSSFNSKPINNNKKLFAKRSVRDVKKISSKQSMTRAMSNSTPNLKSLNKNNNSLLPKHTCDMGLTDNSTFKATPLPNYYSTESLKRNKNLWENCQQKYYTKSLDRINYNNTYQSNKNLNKSSVDFNPDKPFYPPSKYPNIQNPSGNLLRLLETREKYKTPQSRKYQHRNAKETYSPRHTNLSQFKSVPNLNDRKQFLHKTPLDIPKNTGGNNKASKLNSSMTNSYFYPKPTVDEFFIEQNEKFAQSLMNESTLAEKIHSGTLERATTRKNDPPEITDFDDCSPSKSYNDPKRYNSLSIDSLDGQTRHKSKHYNNDRADYKTDQLDGNHYHQNSELCSTCSTDIVQNIPLETNDSLDTPDVMMNHTDDFNTKIDQYNNENEKLFETSYKTEIKTEKTHLFSHNMSESIAGRQYLDQYNSDKYLEHTKPPAVIIEPMKMNVTQIKPYTMNARPESMISSKDVRNKMEDKINGNNHNDINKNKHSHLRKMGDNYIVDFAQSLAAVRSNDTLNGNKQNYNRYDKNVRNMD